MPSTVAETDTYSANIQRPNNGELADAASLLQAFQPLTNRTLYLRNRTLNGQRDITPFGADSTGTADSRTAIQAAIDAVQAGGGGTVRLPYGSYKLNTGLTLYRDVSLVGDGATLLHNHNSQNVITLDTAGSALAVPRRISGIAFESLVITSAYGIADLASATARQLIVSDCSFNWTTQNIAGSFYSLNGVSTSRVAFERCNVRSRAGGDPLVFMAGGSNSYLEIAGGQYRMADTYAESLIFINNTPADIHHAFIDETGHNSGTAYGIEVSGTTDKRISNCRFFQSGLGASIKAAGRLVETDSDWLAGTAYEIPAALNTRSRLSGGNPLVVNSNSTSSISLGALGTGVRAISYVLTGAFGGGGPTFDMPPAVFENQRLTLTVANRSSDTGNWSGVAFTGGGQGNAGVTNYNRGRTWEFVALDIDQDGTLDWIIASDVSYDWIVP